MERNLVRTSTRITQRLRLAIPLLCVGLVWAGKAGALSDDPPQQSDDTSVDADSSHKGRLESIFGDDHEDGGGHEPLHWGALYPSVTVLSSGASVGPELQLWLRDLSGSRLDFRVAGIYTLRQYQYYTAQFGLLPQRHAGPPALATSTTSIFPLAQIEKLPGVENHFVLYGSYRYRDYPEEDYYGVGFEAAEGDHSDFRMKDHLLEAVTGYHFSPRFAITASAGLLETTLSPGLDSGVPQLTILFDPSTAPGLADPPDELILTAGTVADLRDDRRNPHKGAMLMAGVSRFEDRHGAPYEFTRVAGDARVFLPLFSHKHVIAGHAVVSSDSPDAGNLVPFYQQTTLGGSHLLRGYPPFRFRDDALTAFSAEYRFEPFSKLELAAFYDAGEVAPSFSDFVFSELKTSWGGGVRIKSKSRMLLRLEVARSKETTRYLVKTSPSF